MKNKKYLQFTIFFLAFFAISVPLINTAFADVVPINYQSNSVILLPSSAATGLSHGVGRNPIIGLLSNVTEFVTGIIAVIAMLMIVISGIMYIISTGDDKRVETAKNMLTYSIIGLIIALLAYVIVSSIGKML